MEPTSRKDTSALRTVANTQAPADNRIASVAAGSPSGSDRQMRISKVAYYKAQQRGFLPGHDWEGWFAAEREVTGHGNSSDPGSLTESDRHSLASGLAVG
jgi:hypothetical protein